MYVSYTFHGAKILILPILQQTTTTIFILCPEKFYNKNKYMQCEKITMKNRAQPLRNS